MKKLRLLREIYFDRPGSQTFHAFNRSIEAKGIRSIGQHPFEFCTTLGRHLDHRRGLRNYVKIPGRAYIIALEWHYEERLFPLCYCAEIIPLCFDCWPKDYERWIDLFKRHKFRVVFFTARKSCEYFRDVFPDMDCIWLPEAADPKEYKPDRPLAERAIDVLELGRRSDLYHNHIKEILAQQGHVHKFRLEGQARIFPTKNSLVDAWADTKLSVCFPKTITDPEKAGGVETVTFRYFESLASRCLIIGSCPIELKILFGYNPVIEVDWSDPAGQLISILGHLETYSGFVNKNYNRLLEVGSWDVRVASMLSELLKRGYRI